MNEKTIDDTTYFYNELGYILRTETKFERTGYSEVKEFQLAEHPYSPGHYYVKSEKLAFEDPERYNSGFQEIVTSIIQEFSYTKYVKKQDNWGVKEWVENVDGIPPLASRIDLFGQQTYSVTPSAEVGFQRTPGLAPDIAQKVREDVQLP
ncbi:MAG: hypothetical protein HWQ38_09685 [Nostoc sp. NMS7]|uniref:hypothetical protein n=1 Tax=Nostoc sp. NMS7 TaxID=2815391 RepID=UPI0025D3DE78|nr:hypothetical protein [Nostoc sp. NMS7]MBN3946740.1 hypothetical protein [Nostoc sp. NMS7]